MPSVDEEIALREYRRDPRGQRFQLEQLLASGELAPPVVTLIRGALAFAENVDQDRLWVLECRIEDLVAQRDQLRADYREVLEQNEALKKRERVDDRNA